MLYIFLALIFYTAAIMFGAVAARHTNTNLAAGLTNTISAIIPLIIVTPHVIKRTIGGDRLGLMMALASGVTIAISIMAINKSFSLTKVAIVVPLVYGGAIFLSALLSYVIFSEKIDLLQGVGLGLLGAGLILIIIARAQTA